MTPGYGLFIAYICLFRNLLGEKSTIRFASNGIFKLFMPTYKRSKTHSYKNIYHFFPLLQSEFHTTSKITDASNKIECLQNSGFSVILSAIPI